MKYVFRKRHLVVPSLLLGALCAGAVSVYAATTIGTDIATDGTLSVRGSTTLSSLNVGPASAYVTPTVNKLMVVDPTITYSSLIEADQTSHPEMGVNALYVAARALHNTGINLNAVGINSDGTNEGLGTTDVVNGGYFTASNFGAGHSNHLWALETFTYLTAGTADESIGLLVNTNSGLTTINYGIVVQDQTSGTNNYAVKTGLGKVEFGDTVNAPAYKVGGVAGLNRVLNLKGSDGNNCTESVTNGIITASTCP